jgi:integrase
VQKKSPTRKGGRRIRVATGVYRDKYGFGIPIRGKEHRYPLGTPLDELRRDRKELKEAAAIITVQRGILLEDIETYLETIADARKRRDARARLAHWARTPLARLPRGAIRSADIKAQMAAWVEGRGVPDQFAVATVNKCVSVLRAVYRELNDDDDPDPTLRVKKLHVPKQPPRAIAGGYAVVEQILQALPTRGRWVKGTKQRAAASKTTLRLTLEAYTGWPPKQIQQIDPATDIRWGRRQDVVRLRPRRKGRGVAEHWMPVKDPKARAALRAFVKGNATGPFSTSAAYKVWVAACERVRAAQRAENLTRVARGDAPLPVLPHIYPYQLRHTFITHVLRRSKNLAGAQYLAMHADPRQTVLYGEAAVPQLAQQAIDAAPFDGGLLGGARKSRKSGRKQARKDRASAF